LSLAFKLEVWDGLGRKISRVYIKVKYNGNNFFFKALNISNAEWYNTNDTFTAVKK
jgi:CRISPR/Cas system CSM-associated protein Csm3 (group 7 of RAMP superfamily)